MMPLETKKLAIKETEEENKRHEPFIRTFASGHYLSKLAYVLAELKKKEPFNVRVLNENGTLKKHVVYPMPLKEGLYAYILVPTSQSNTDVKVLFRGTDFSDLSSAIINLEMYGPGYESFEQSKNIIFNYLSLVLRSHYGRILPTDMTIQVCGHSQGGALAQLFTAEMLKQRQETKSWDHVKAIHMTVLNSPGIPFSSAATAEAALAEQKKTKQIEVVANYGMVGGDAVQVTGMISLLAKALPELAKVNLLKINKGLEGLWLTDFYFPDGIQLSEILSLAVNAAKSVMSAHPNNHFFAMTENKGKIDITERYDYYTNEKSEDLPILQKELCNKIVMLQHLAFLPRETLLAILNFVNTDVKQAVNELFESPLPFAYCYNYFAKKIAGDIPEGQKYEIDEDLILNEKKGQYLTLSKSLT